MIKKSNNTDKKKKYWYKFIHEECVLCGCGSTIKCRVYDTPKPKNPAKRHIYQQFACGIHFV